jgi:hypothetical protein
MGTQKRPAFWEQVGRSTMPAAPDDREQPAAVDPAQAAIRAAAGKRYAEAVAELVEAYVDLAAIEGAMPSSGANVLKTFAAHQVDDLPDLRHREFVPNAPSHIKRLTAMRRETITSSPTPGSSPVARRRRP